MPDRTTTLRDLFKPPEGQTLTAEQQTIYAKAFADSIAALSSTADSTNALLASLRATEQKYHDLADLMEQYLAAADHMKDGKMMDDEDEEEDEENDNPKEEEGEKPKPKD